MKKSYISIIFAIMVSLIFDNYFLQLIVNHRNQYLNSFFILISNDYIIYFSIILLSVLLYKKIPKIVLLWLSSALTFVIVYLTKLIIMRPRPEVIKLVQESSYSFPSLHAALMFMIYSFAEKEIPKSKYYFLILTLLISFSRVYNGVHFPSDVVFGAIMGYLVGITLISIENKHNLIKKFLKL